MNLTGFPKFALILLFVALASSCQYRKYYPVQVNYGLNTVTAVDLEEDGYLLSSGQDEVYVLYSLAAVDQNGNYYDSRRRAYGPDAFTYKGHVMSGYSPLSIKVPARGKAVFSVQLVEDDDYFAVSNALDDAKTVVDIAKFASSLDKRDNLAALRAARSLRMASRVLNIAGIIITVVDIIDDNDELMAFCAVLDENQLQSLANEGNLINKNYTNTGSNWGDRYEYKINFSLFASIIPVKPIKERVKSRTPNFIVNISPFVIDQRLNNYWTNSPDKLLVKSGENEYDWSDGLYNKNLSASFGFGIAPAFRMGLRTYGRFYLQGNYRRLPYLLDFEGKNYKIDNSYFNYTNGSSADFSVEDVELDITNYGASSFFKLIANDFSWDLGGGIHFNSAKTKFIGSSFGNPSATFVYDQNQNVFKSNKTPFSFTKIGFGSINKNKGFQLTFGVSASKPNFEFNDNFKIFYDLGNGTSELVSTPKNAWRLAYSFGVDFLF